jgi:type I restriction enzyme, S subunit
MSLPAFNNLSVWQDCPKDWKQVRLKYAARFSYGDPLISAQREEGDIPVFGSNGIVGCHKLANTLAPLIVVGRKGSFGKITYSENCGFVIDTAYLIDSRYSKEHLRWLYYTLQTLGLDEISQDTGVPGLSREKAYECYLGLPPLQTQKLIARFLDRKTAAIDTLIAKKQCLIQLLEEKRTALINQAVTKGLNPNAPMKDSGISWIGEIPEHWEIIRIKHLLEEIIDTEHKTATFYPDGEYLVVRTSNVRQGQLIFKDAKYTDLEGFTEWTRRGKPQPGDILFTREAPPGEACIVPCNLDLCLGQRMVLFRVQHELLDGDFGVYSLYAGLANEFIKSLSQGSTVSHFNMSDISNIPILTPPVEEQQSIVNHLKEIIQRISLLVEKTISSIEKLQEYRRSLITAAVTGKLEISEVEPDV